MAVLPAATVGAAVVVGDAVAGTDGLAVGEGVAVPAAVGIVEGLSVVIGETIGGAVAADAARALEAPAGVPTRPDESATTNMMKQAWMEWHRRDIPVPFPHDGV